MREPKTFSVKLLPYVLLGASINVAVILAVYVWTYAFEREVPFNSSVHVLAIAISLAWFAKRENRPMLWQEKILFAAWTVLTQVAVAIISIFALLVGSGQAVTLHNAGLLIGTASLSPEDLWPLVAITLFSAAKTFGISMLFAWLITRKLPRPHG